MPFLNLIQQEGFSDMYTTIC